MPATAGPLRAACLQGGDWSQQEVLSLLQAVVQFGDRWELVAARVGSKTQARPQIPAAEQALVCVHVGTPARCCKAQIALVCCL